MAAELEQIVHEFFAPKPVVIECPPRDGPAPWVETEFAGSELEFLFQLGHHPAFTSMKGKKKVVHLDLAADACNAKYHNNRNTESVKQALYRQKKRRAEYDRDHAKDMPQFPEGFVIPKMEYRKGNQYTMGAPSPWHTYSEDLGLTEVEYAFWLALHPTNRVPLAFNRIPRISRITRDVQNTTPDFAKIAGEVNAVFQRGQDADSVASAFGRYYKERVQFYKGLREMGLDITHAS
jgi:hypothetical protein